MCGRLCHWPLEEGPKSLLTRHLFIIFPLTLNREGESARRARAEYADGILGFVRVYSDSNLNVWNLDLPHIADTFSAFNIYIIPAVTIINFKKLTLLAQNSRTYTTSSLHTSTGTWVHPWNITGFASAESSFILLINKNSKYKMGYSLQASFSICVHNIKRIGFYWNQSGHL